MSKAATQPEVTRVSEKEARREVRSALQYPLLGRKLSVKHLSIAGTLVTFAGVILFYSDGVKREAKYNRARMVFQTPSVAENPEASSLGRGIFGIYSRAGDARAEAQRREEKKTAKSALRARREPEKLTGPVLILRPRDTKIPPGTLVKAVLRSGGSNHWVKAQLKEAVVIRGERVIDEGSTVVGRGSSTEERLFISFTQLIDRDGRVESIQAEAVDASDQSVGLKGSKVGSRAAKLAAGIGLNFLTGAAEALQDSQGMQGVVIRPPTARNVVLQGSARAALEESQEIMTEARNSRPEISVNSGQEFYLMFVGENQ